MNLFKVFAKELKQSRKEFEFGNLKFILFFNILLRYHDKV